ncbi:MAG: phosphotransferase-like protein [Hyphomicrobiales bacterium]
MIQFEHGKSFDIILLNGISSSGKTSIAHCLQSDFTYCWLNFSIDSVLYSLPEDDLNKMIAGDPINRAGYEYAKLASGYSQALAALTRAGNKIISDNALVTAAQKQELMSAVMPFKVLWVGVHCDLTVATQREKARGDRVLGTAKREHLCVHSNIDYDICVDTTHRSPQKIAKEIIAFMSLHQGPLLKAWSHDADFMMQQPGYISTQLHEGIAGSSTFMNYAVWQDVASFRAAFTSPEFQKRIAEYPKSAVARPHLFKKLAVANHCVA